MAEILDISLQNGEKLRFSRLPKGFIDGFILMYNQIDGEDWNANQLSYERYEDNDEDSDCDLEYQGHRLKIASGFDGEDWWDYTLFTTEIEPSDWPKKLKSSNPFKLLSTSEQLKQVQAIDQIFSYDDFIPYQRNFHEHSEFIDRYIVSFMVTQSEGMRIFIVTQFSNFGYLEGLLAVVKWSQALTVEWGSVIDTEDPDNWIHTPFETIRANLVLPTPD